MPSLPSCLPWKYWTNKQRTSSKHNTDYIYLQWHFMTSQQDQVATHTTSPTTKPNPTTMTPRDQPAVTNKDPAVRRSSVEEEERGQTSEERKYSDIQSWLSSLPDSVCTEIYCDCCDGLQPSPPPPVLPRRQDSIVSVTSVTSTTSSNCSCSECLHNSQLSDDESLYSSQLRRKSRDIFLS